MPPSRSSTALLLVLGALAGAAAGEGPLVFEAEQHLSGGAALTVAEEASGGKVAKQDGSWRPLARLPRARVPDGRLAVWVRHRRGPVQLKSAGPDGQRAYQWSMAKGEAWAWGKVFDGASSDLPGDLLVIRSKTGTGAATELDQIVIDVGGRWAPDGTAPAAGASGASPAAPPAPAPDPAQPAGPAPAAGDAPRTRPSGWVPHSWDERRAAFAAARAQQQGAVVFLGDSITRGFDLETQFPSLHAANHGITGDLVGNMALRLEEDVLPLAPAGLVLLAGTNDIKDGKAPAVVAQRLFAIVDRMHERVPSAAVVLCLVMPRAGETAARVPPVNELLRAGAAARGWLRICDTFAAMAGPDGAARRELLADGVHPNAAGYAAWAAALAPLLPTVPRPAR